MPFNQNVIGSLRVDLNARVAAFARHAGADSVTLWLYDGATEEFGLPLSWGLKHEESFSDHRNRPRKDGFAARMMLQRRVQTVPHLQGDDELRVPFVRREGIRAYAAVPLLDVDAPIGILFVNFRQPMVFNKATLGQYRRAAANLVSLITESRVFSGGEPASTPPDPSLDEVLQAVVLTICGTLHRPVVLWLFDSPRDRRVLRVSAGTEVNSKYLNETLDVTTDKSVVTEVVRSGKSRLVVDISTEPHVKFQEYVDTEQWKSAAYCPIFSRGQCVGTFEVFYFDRLAKRDADFAALERLATIATVSIHNFERINESHRMREIAQEISAQPDIRNALARIADGARDLTASDSASILLYNRSTDKFEFETHAPKETPFVACRTDLETLARRVIVTEAKSVSAGVDGIPGLLAEPPLNYRSFIGIGVPLEDDLVGMFGVFSRQVSQFSDHDAHILRMLASQVSVALGWVQRLLTPTLAVDKAAAGLVRQNADLSKLCDEVLKLGYEYVAIQMIQTDERIIRTNISKSVDSPVTVPDWSGRSAHYLTPEQHLRDIQADIVLKAENFTEASVEVITGWDPRFDEWIYEKYQHSNLTRVFVPILIVRDEHNRVVEDWANHCQWAPGAPVPNFKPMPGQPADTLPGSPDGFCTAYRKLLPGMEMLGWHFEVLGTVETGYQTGGAAITREDVEELTHTVITFAFELLKTQLMYVFETVLKCAEQIVHADAASLHFHYSAGLDGEDAKYNYNFSDWLDWGEFHYWPPRADGIGRQAIREGAPVFRPDFSSSELDLAYKRYHPRMYEEGYRTTGAFPFYVDDLDGVLYLHFRHAHRFAPDEQEWITLFVNKAADAILHATSYTRMRDTENQLTTLNSVFQSLVRTPLAGSTLREIAWNALNLLAADIVTIYECHDAAPSSIGKPIRAGRLIEPKATENDATAGTVPFQIISERVDVYECNARAHPILGNHARAATGGASCFVEREQIVSSCAILLRAGDEVVGVLFVNFRRAHLFPPEEKKLIAMLGSSAAIAIQNRRSLEVLVDVGNKVVETPDLTQLLEFILVLSVKATRAELAEVWLVDYIAGEVECVNCFARRGVSYPVPWKRRISLGRQIVGYVAQHPESVAAMGRPIDLDREPFLKLGTSLKTARSVLCLPLLDDRKVLGVINLESSHIGSFNEIDAAILAALAKHAVIAIKNEKSQKTAAANADLANLGITSQGLHQCYQMAGLILAELQSARGCALSEAAMQCTDKIENAANSIIAEAKGLQSYISTKKPVLVDMRTIVIEAIGQCAIPGNVQLHHVPPSSISPVLGNAFVLINVFLILIVNALDAMPEGGVLTISYDEIETLHGGVSKYVAVSVEDTGKGIAADRYDEIFQLGNSDKEKQVGAGFGLWWARPQILRLDGEFRLRSKLGQGATFTIALPVAKET